jgi:hydrogenase maturation protease
MSSPGPDTVVVGGVRLGRGSRVRLRPRSHADILDLTLGGRVAVIDCVEQDDEGGIHLAVTLEDDPGRDLGEARLPGHRFFYLVQDVEPLEPAAITPERRRILVAGIGNMFLGDDGFGVEVVRRLGQRGTGPGVDVVDFGIRGMDLLHALQREYHAVIFIDAAVRGQEPGTLTVLEPDLPAGGGVPVDGHGMDPVKVLHLARELGSIPARALVVCCEPATVLEGGPDEDLLVALSEPVRAVLDEAVRLVESLISELADPTAGVGGARTPKVVA